MSEHSLHLISVYAFEIGWICFGAIFVFRKRWPRDKTSKRDPASVVGVLIQTLSLFTVWISHRHYALSPLGFWLHVTTTILVVLIIFASLWTTWSALRVLGKQWSLQARVLEHHQLVREGPYRFIRHPIYTGILGMIVAGGLVWTHSIAFVITLLLFAIGTAIREAGAADPPSPETIIHLN